MPTFPVAPGDAARAARRAAQAPIPSGRPVTGLTLSRRERLWEIFLNWSREQNCDFVDMLDKHQIYIDDINLFLERFGRELYAAGKPYAHYAETLNQVSNLKPAIRRQLQGAWSFGFSWVRQEPSSHHVAMPGPVALAVITTALLWGWLRFAGMIALMWGGLLRPGEALAMERRDLLLPSDGDGTLPFAMVSIADPKTRFKHARHQSVKLDMADMLHVCELAFASLKEHQKLWPMSGQTLRQRFQKVLDALQLPRVPYNGVRPLELASLRAGSATWIMATTENGELLQRRGRWANRRMMDIYVQEVTALVYLKQIPSQARDLVTSIASSFEPVLQRSSDMVRARIPLNVWPILFMSWKRLCLGKQWRQVEELGWAGMTFEFLVFCKTGAARFLQLLWGYVQPLDEHRTFHADPAVPPTSSVKWKRSCGVDDHLSTMLLCWTLKSPLQLLPAHQLMTFEFLVFCKTGAARFLQLLWGYVQPLDEHRTFHADPAVPPTSSVKWKRSCGVDIYL